MREVLASLAGRAMIIGVDRLDYSKGIGLRMQAFERFLADHPHWRGAVTYLQITPRSRSEIREYAEMERRISETVGRVNGRYGEASWTPIRYVNRPYSRSALAGLYRSSRAALVTPLRDGMNLVAKEYRRGAGPRRSRRADPVALCRRCGRMPGRAAGQSLRCRERSAPRSSRRSSMPLDERQGRHGELVRVLSQNDLKFWGERFIAALTRPVAGANWAPQRFA